MNLNTLIAIITVSFFTLIGISISILTKKSEHERRMELIQEKEKLVNLLDEQEVQKNILETKRLIEEVDSMLTVKKDN
jgi:hypothetical protein